MAEIDPRGPRGRARPGAVGHICVVDPKELGATFGDNATPRILAVAGALDPEGPLAPFSPSRPEHSVMLLARLKMDHALFASDEEEEPSEPESPEEDEARVQLDPSLLPWRERLSVLTIHGAKGLEADIVVLGDVREDRYPFEHPAADLLAPFGITRHVVREEERRLLYVAVTRARHALVLLGPKELSPDLLLPMHGVRSLQVPGRELANRPVGGRPVWTTVGVPATTRAPSARDRADDGAPTQAAEGDRVIEAIDGGRLHAGNVSASRLLGYGRASGVWGDIDRGRAILDGASELDQYLHSYGPMVRLQWQHLLSGALGEPIPAGRLRVTDYGCGQGLATMLVLDRLRATPSAEPLPARVASVTLIDPSRSALARAERAIGLYGAPVTPVCSALDGLRAEARAEGMEDARGDATELHILSNILDIDAFHLGVLVSKMFARRGRHHVLAVSPDRDFEGGTPRLERFVQIVQSRFKDRAVVDKLAWQLDNPDRMKAFGFIIRAED